MRILTSANFKEEVLQSNIPVMVDFFTNWCGPCRNMKPAIESVAAECEDKYKVFGVDIDDAHDLAVEYNINVIPTIVVFENGQVKKSVTGSQSKEQLLKLLG